MSDTKKSSKLGLGLLIGTVLGGLAGLFLSPASGKKNRDLVAKKIKQLEKLLADKDLEKKLVKIFGTVTDEARKLYGEVKKGLIVKLAEARETVENIDIDQYKAMLNEVIDTLKKEFSHEAKVMDKLKEQLIEDWYEMNKEKSKKKN